MALPRFKKSTPAKTINAAATASKIKDTSIPVVHHIDPLPTGNAKHRTELPVGLRPYAYHGLDVSRINRTGSAAQAVTNCLFCDDPKHFYINAETGQYDCKKCGELGNQYGWLKKRHEIALAETKPEHWQELSQLRGGFPWIEYKMAGIAHELNSVGNAEWLIPVRNLEGAFANLCVWGGKGSQVMGTDNCAMHLFGGERIKTSPADTILVFTEGKWDEIALNYLVRLFLDESTNKDYPKSSTKIPYGKLLAVGLPGAGTLKTEWIEKLEPVIKGRSGVLMLDNDMAGAKGTESAVRKLSGVLGNLSKLEWSPDVFEGYDLSNFIADRLFPQQAAGDERDPMPAVQVLDELFGLCVPAKGDLSETDQSAAPPRPRIYVDKKTGQPYRPSWETVVKEYRKVFNTSRDTEAALAVMFAVCVSNQIKTKNPLWVHLVGPPGSGKTEALMTLSDAPNCLFRSQISAQSLISGFQTYAGNEDKSEIPRFVGKTVVMKDWTEILSLGDFAKRDLYSVLRGGYDGSASRTFGNGETRVYDRTTLNGQDCHWSFLSGVTHAIYAHADPIMGERFLEVEFISAAKHDAHGHVLNSLRTGAMEFRERTDHLRQVAFEFLDFEIDPTTLPEPSEEMGDRLTSLARVLSYLRAGVDRDRSGELSCRPQVDTGARPAQQLRKLLQALTYVFERKNKQGEYVIDEEIYSYAERVAFDSAHGWNLDIVVCLVKNFPEPRTINELAVECQIGPTNLRHRLANMIELGMVTMSKPEKRKGPGQPEQRFALSEAFMHLWKQAKIKRQFGGPVNALQLAYERSRKGKEPLKLKTLDAAKLKLTSGKPLPKSGKPLPKSTPKPLPKTKSTGKPAAKFLPRKDTRPQVKKIINKKGNAKPKQKK